MQTIHEDLIQIFQTQQVMDFQSLQKKLKNRSSRSIFRYLSSVGYFSSFTHAGKYYTLKNIPQLNSVGVWFYHKIGFSKYGTLKNTIIQLIDDADAGKTHDELKMQLHIRLHNTLLDLVKTNKILRRKLQSDYVYFSINPKKLKKQILRRENSLQGYREVGCPDWIVIEVLAAVIRITRREDIDSKKIVLELRQRKIIITQDKVENILNKCNLKKTPGSQ